MSCEVTAYVKVKYHGANLSTDELNNFIIKMYLFYKINLIIE